MATTLGAPTAGLVETISTARIERTRRLDYWRDIISSTFVALDCDAPESRNFDAKLTTGALRDVQFSTVESGAQHVQRTPQRIRQAPCDHFLLSFQQRGSGRVIQDGRAAALQPGDFALYDTARPYELVFEEDFEQLVLRVPRTYLARRVVRPERLTAIAFTSRSHSGAAVASSFVAALAQKIGQLPGAISSTFHQALIDVLVGSLAEGVHVESTPTAANRLVMRQRIRTYVEQRLSDPALNCSRVAAAHGISVRYLHKLFAEEGVSLTEWLWSRRLERARAALESSASTGQSVTQIAYDWGFKDPAHFSRAFRARYGAAPSELRRVPK
jgi:AraC-like DNA-binding protein